MNNYQLQFTKASEKYLKKIDKVTRLRILESIYKLTVNPFELEGVKKLKTVEPQYRIIIGKYRVVYEVKDGLLVIVVLLIDSRGGVYKRL